MMDLPLMMAAPPSKAGEGATLPTSRGGDPAAFEATLTTLLGGEAGKEVVEMVEALELLADLERGHDDLAAIGWPLPALLAMRTQDGGAQRSDATTDVELQAILDGVVALDVADEQKPPALDEPGELLATLAPVDAEVEGNIGVDGDVEVEGDSEGVVPGDIEVASDADTDAAQSTPAAPAGVAPTTSIDDRVDPEEGELLGRETRLRATGAGEEARAADTATRASDTARSGSRTESPVDRVPTGSSSVDQPITTDASKQAAARAPVMSSAVLRVMEAVERLETLPPPRQLTIDLGEVRVRVAMEDGQVRLTLLEGDGESAEELLEDARDQLAQRGFDLGGDGDERPGAEGRSDEDRKTETPSHRRASQRVPAGLRL